MLTPLRPPRALFACCHHPSLASSGYVRGSDVLSQSHRFGPKRIPAYPASSRRSRTLLGWTTFKRCFPVPAFACPLPCSHRRRTPTLCIRIIRALGAGSPRRRRARSRWSRGCSPASEVFVCYSLRSRVPSISDARGGDSLLHQRHRFGVKHIFLPTRLLRAETGPFWTARPSSAVSPFRETPS